MEKRFYTIEETAERLGISKQTIVRYESKGIFPKPNRNPINKWRVYTSGDIQKLHVILERGK